MHAILLAAALVLVQPAPAARDDATTAVPILLERMAEAVQIADAEGYLALIDPTEPEFAKEQENWAKDFVKRPAAAFAVELDGGLLVEIDGGRAAIGTLTMRWRMPDRPERTVRHPARFTRRDGAWLYAGEAWKRVAAADGSNVALYLDDALRDVAASVVELLPEVREHVNAGFETPLDDVQVVKIYDEMEHLQASIFLSYEDALGGWNEPGESIKILATPRSSARQLRVLLAHEYGHVVTFSMGDRATEIPWWVAEGAAELAAERYSGRSGSEAVDRMIRQLAEQGGLAEWDQLSDFRNTRPEHGMLVYKQGQHMLGYVSGRFGRTARNQWIARMTRGETLDEATQGALGMSFADLDREWRASLIDAVPGGDEEAR
ncbi:MAG TPA: hypothetical protein PLU35_12565 [Phycisphaerales bacterium]|nr:hypothetical protein [Phycisphaerales bacterium]